MAIFALGVAVGFYLPANQETEQDLSQVGGVYFIGERDFPDGIAVDGTTVIDEDGNIDAPITSTTGSFSSTLSVTGAASLSSSLTVGTNLTGTDGVIGYTDDTASTTDEVDILTFTRTHSDATTGADDGIGSCIEWLNEDEDGNATTTAKICGVSLDTATSSQDVALTFDIKTQNGYTYFEGMRLDEHGYLGLGTTTPDSKLTVLSTGTQLKLSYDASNYGTFAVGSGGDLTISASGGDISFGDDNLSTTGNANVGGLTHGNTMVASSTSNAAETLSVTDLTSYSGMDYTPGDLAVTLSIPASSTLESFISNAGKCFDWRFRNLDETAATSTTIAAGTGIDLVENENGDVVIEGGNEAQLKFCRELDTDITVYVDEYIAAD